MIPTHHKTLGTIALITLVVISFTGAHYLGWTKDSDPEKVIDELIYIDEEYFITDNLNKLKM